MGPRKLSDTSPHSQLHFEHFMRNVSCRTKNMLLQGAHLTHAAKILSFVPVQHFNKSVKINGRELHQILLCKRLIFNPTFLFFPQYDYIPHHLVPSKSNPLLHHSFIHTSMIWQKHLLMQQNWNLLAYNHQTCFLLLLIFPHSPSVCSISRTDGLIVIGVTKPLSI